MNYKTEVGATYILGRWEVNGKQAFKLGKLIQGTPDEHSHHEVNGYTVYYNDRKTAWYIGGREEAVGRSFCYGSLVKYIESLPTTRTYTGLISDWPNGTFLCISGGAKGCRINHIRNGKGTYIFDDDGRVSSLYISCTVNAWVKE